MEAWGLLSQSQKMSIELACGIPDVLGYRMKKSITDYSLNRTEGIFE
jgi:hypothetical protein